MRIRFPTVEMFVTRPVLSVITDTSMFGFSCDRVIGLELAPPPVKVIPRKTNLPDTESKPHAEARTSLPTLVRLIEAVMYSGIISHSFGSLMVRISSYSLLYTSLFFMVTFTTFVL